GIRRVTQVDHQVLADYIQFLQQKPNPRFGRIGLSDASIQRRLASLGSYFEYLRATTNPKQKNPTKDLVNKWHKNNQPKPADEITLEALLFGITTSRDRLIVALFLATGLRVMELHQLNRDTISLQIE